MTKTLPMNRRLMSLCACLVVFSMPLVSAQDRSQYRDYRIGDDLRSIAEQSGVAPPMARIIPPEPAGLQELAWRPHYFRGAARQSDAVARVTFGFYNDQLFRIVIDYDRLRTEGMTEADMVGAISKTYGPPSRRVVPTRAVAERAGQDADLLVAVWEDADYSVTLLRMPDSLGVQNDRGVHSAWGPGPGCGRRRQCGWICTKRLNTMSLHAATTTRTATPFKRSRGLPTRPPSSRDRSFHPIRSLRI